MSNTILTITLNPSIDKHFIAEQLIPDDKIRCENPHVDAGGGGINVAKAIHKLGTDVDVFFLSGGLNGNLLEQLLKQEGLSLFPFPLNNNTRENIILTESKTNKQFRLVTKGPQLNKLESETIFKHLESVLNKYTYVVASGSLPDGLADDFYARIADLVKNAGGKFILDASGASLKLAVEKNIFLFKPSIKELCLLLNKPQIEIKDIPEVAADLIAKGNIEIMVISLGKDGAMIVTKNETHHVLAPVVNRKSTVGAGDSMVGGMVWALLHGKSISEVLKMGVACGTAATMQEGTKLFDVGDIEKLLKQLG